MKASEFVTEKKKRKKRGPRWAAYGPGPYGGYGFAAGYSGSDGSDGGVGEASYPGNIGIMELTKFFQTATEQEKKIFQKLLEKGKKGLAWKLIQDVTDTKLQGKEFEFSEGWKDTLWNLGISTAIGLGAVGGLTVKQALNSPDVPIQQKIEIVKKAELDHTRELIKKIEQGKQVGPDVKVEKPKKSTAEEPKVDANFNQHEELLIKTAKAAGIKGIELAAFLAQCAHESHDFKSMVEYGGSLDFRKYDPKYAPKKAKALGNKKAGDGARYKGRGYIQITGRYNYKRAGQALGLPLESKPELAEKPAIAAKIAVWFWQHRVQPNVNNFNDVKQVTKPINPRMNGLQDRKENFKDYKMTVSYLR